MPGTPTDVVNGGDWKLFIFLEGMHSKDARAWGQRGSAERTQVLETAHLFPS